MQAKQASLDGSLSEIGLAEQELVEESRINVTTLVVSFVYRHTVLTVSFLFSVQCLNNLGDWNKLQSVVSRQIDSDNGNVNLVWSDAYILARLNRAISTADLTVIAVLG